MNDYKELREVAQAISSADFCRTYVAAKVGQRILDALSEIEAIRAERDALRAAINEHNADCVGQCEARKKVGKTSCYMLGYDRECGDCPRDGMLILAAIDAHLPTGEKDKP